MACRKEIPTYVVKDRTLRIKIIDTCGMTCTFCHNEGTPVTVDNVKNQEDNWTTQGDSGRTSIYAKSNGVRFLPAPIFPDASFAYAVRDLRDALGFNEIHLTGGEPTLHPNLPQIVKLLTEARFKVCMTSNGENGEKILDKCLGLDRVNFSIFGTTTEELSQVQHRKYQNTLLAERKINALEKSIATALQYGIKASANIVVPDYSHAPRVKRILEEYSPNLSVRLLNSLDDPTSISAIYRILEELQAIPIAKYVTAGVSGSKIAYRLPTGRVIYFKQIRPVRLPETCSTCRFNNDMDCQEGYYGIRLYKDRNDVYQVGVCIQRMDLCLPLNQFVESALCREIIDFREREYKELTVHQRSLGK